MFWGACVTLSSYQIMKTKKKKRKKRWEHDSWFEQQLLDIHPKQQLKKKKLNGNTENHKPVKEPKQNFT